MSVDFRPDAAIQEMLRSAFQDNTIFAIVHRLLIILDYGCVIVIECGEIRTVGIISGEEGFNSTVEQSIHEGKGGE